MFTDRTSGTLSRTISLAVLFSLLVLHGQALSIYKHAALTYPAHTYRMKYLSLSSSSENEAQRLKEEADALRAEVASFEQQKQDIARQEEEKQQQILSEKQKIRMRYSAEVPILKGDGTTVVERVDFSPRMKDGTARVVM